MVNLLFKIPLVLDTTLREESVCGRKFCGSAEPQNLSVFAENTFAVGSFE